MKNVEKKIFINCEKCGKRLIERLPNGLWKFVFGSRRSRAGHISKTPVNILIHGSLRIQCLKRTCQHMNVLNYFPSIGDLQSVLDTEKDHPAKVL